VLRRNGQGHYLGPVVTFGEWLSYQPPKAGGRPSFSLAVLLPTQQQTAYRYHSPYSRDFTAVYAR